MTHTLFARLAPLTPLANPQFIRLSLIGLTLLFALFAPGSTHACSLAGGGCNS